MATYGGFGRTNYVKVKDADAFEEAAAEFGNVHRGKDDTFCVLASSDSGEFDAWDEATDEEHSLADILPDHLADGQVAILMGAGAEKLCYICGWALAIHSSGETERITLSDIYAQAQEAWPDASITEATS